MRRSGAAASVLLLLAGGCTVGPDFKRPDPPQVQRWQNGAAADPRVSFTTDPDPRWWAAFGDPVLTELTETAIRQNLDVQQAVLRVVEARQNIVSARSAGLPNLNGTASYLRDQLGARGILESRGVYRQLNALADEAQGAGGALGSTLGGALGSTSSGSLADRVLGPITQPINLYQAALSASWELDLFGRVRRSVEQARAQTEAQAEAVNDALTSLESEVAQAYVQLRGAQALRASQETNIRSAQGSLDLTLSRQTHGLSTMLDVDQARTQLLTLERQLPEYEKQERQAVDRLNVLIAKPPGTLDARLLQPAPLPRLPTAVGAGVPSTLARRRPRYPPGRGAAARGDCQHRRRGRGVLSRRLADRQSRRPRHRHQLHHPVGQPLLLRRTKPVAADLPGRPPDREPAPRPRAGGRGGAALPRHGAERAARGRGRAGLVPGRSDRARPPGRHAALGGRNPDAGDEPLRAWVTDYLQVLDAQRTVDDSRQQLVQQEMTLANDVVTLYRALGGGWEAPGAGSEPPRVPGAPPIAPAALDSVAAGVK